MKLKEIIVSCTMIAVLGACSDKDSGTNVVQPEGDTKSVYLQMNTGKQKTRADVPTAEGTTAELLSAIIYFMDNGADPLVYDVRIVGAGGGGVTIAQLETGVQFEGIPQVVEQVYIVGNYNSSDVDENTADFPLFNGTTLSEIENTVLNIQEVSYPLLSNGTPGTTGLLTVMTGTSDVVTFGSNQAGWNGSATLTANDLYADVTLIPIVARLEIEEITYGGTALASFTLEGIYINNYYQEVSVDLDYTDFDITNNGSDTTFYDVSNAAFAYTDYSTLYDIVDEDATVAANAASMEPDDDVWAYQVFGNSPDVPHIILKLTDVTTVNGTVLGTRYITVTGYEAGGTPLATFAPNTVYKITDLNFTDDDISIIPEPDNVSVWVHVDVQPWDTVTVTPVI